MEQVPTSKPIEHKKLGVRAVLHDFSQATFEAYHEALFLAGARTTAAKNGAVVRSAIAAGIVTGLTVEAIKDMKPAAVVWLDGEIHRWVVEITTPPADELPN